MAFDYKELSAGRQESRQLMRARLNGIRTIEPIIARAIADGAASHADVAQATQDLLAAFRLCMDDLCTKLPAGAGDSHKAQLGRITATLFASHPDPGQVVQALVAAMASVEPVEQEPYTDSDNDSLAELLAEGGHVAAMWAPIGDLLASRRGSQVLFVGTWDEAHIMRHLAAALRDATSAGTELFLQRIPQASRKDTSIARRSIMGTAAALYTAVIKQEIAEQMRQAVAAQKAPPPDQQAFVKAQKDAPIPPMLARAAQRTTDLIRDVCRPAPNATARASIDPDKEAACA
jgi:hypothetical protein